MIAMICRPVEFVAVIFFVHGVLRTITRNIDKCKGLAQKSVPSGPALPRPATRIAAPNRAPTATARLRQV